MFAQASRQHMIEGTIVLLIYRKLSQQLGHRQVDSNAKCTVEIDSVDRVTSH